MPLRLALILLCGSLLSPVRAQEPLSLFNGHSLAGWEGDPAWWRVEDGALTGGSLTERVPHNYFLVTTRTFQNFELRLRLKLTGMPGRGMINSGVQIRSVRVPGSTEMIGYQVDAGPGWWGKLYDESRRRRVIAESLDAAGVQAAVRENDWNDYRILAEGPRLRTWINGVPALDFTETDPAIPLDGHIGLQIHSGGPAQVQVKDLTLRELPPTPGAPTWPSTPAAPPPPPARAVSYNTVATPALSPAEQARSFRVPEGFEVELVAAESEGIGKFITVDWDARMRLWTMTALEYPVDANEDEAGSAALFQRGGRDRVLVFDHPYGQAHPGEPAGGKPRVFADGLVMPLGILPAGDSALVQYGSEIRRYHDTDGDGRADRHEVVLTGFGTEDSHLFPHQFLRQPGGWILVAQGLFNYSHVQRPGGVPFADGAKSVRFDQCKLGRFTPDGAHFESLTAGPNNIWGLVTSREGETFLQEANDLGYSIIPYAPGIHVATGSRDRLRPYQPLMPPPFSRSGLGGTGLSGLALAEDADGFFRAPAVVGVGEDTRVFYLANPITSAIQLVRAVPAEGRYRYEKLPDFLTSTDPWFRPIAVHFGPDGALYIVDWYNRIISHNEVPRNHPDRDKTRGRIWRVRHRDQPRRIPPDLTQLDNAALVARLDDASAVVSRRAWLELADRRDRGVLPALRAIVSDERAPVSRRLAALWAWEGIEKVDTSTLRRLAAAPIVALRREAARLAAAQRRPEAEATAILAPVVHDADASVRAAVGDALRRVTGAGEATIRLALQLARPPLSDGDAWVRYERDFERYLARWACETFPAATRRLLESAAGRALPVESQLLGWLGVGGREAALQVVNLASRLERPLRDDELGALVAHSAEPAVQRLLGQALGHADQRTSTLCTLLALRTSFEAGPLQPALTSAVTELLRSGDAAGQTLGAEAAGAFRLTTVEPELTRLVAQSTTGAPPSVAPTGLAALRALGEIGGGDSEVLETLARQAKEGPVREAALQALGQARDTGAATRLVGLMAELPVNRRGRALDLLTRSATGARALLAGLTTGQVPRADLGATTIERLRAVLPDDPRVEALWQEIGGDRVHAGESRVATAAEAAAEAERFARFRSLARRTGDPAQGRELFAGLCLSCHLVAGQGGQIGPPLDGVGHTGLEAILRNVLTPSAAMESAYRTYRVVTHDGTVQEGFLAADHPEAVIVRFPGAAERRIERTQIREAGYLSRSLMPDGLLDALSPEQVSDLLTYLRELR